MPAGSRTPGSDRPRAKGAPARDDGARRTRRLAAAGIVIAVAGGLVLTRGRAKPAAASDAEVPSAAAPASADIDTAPQAAAAPPSSASADGGGAIADEAPLPASLAGTTEDGALRVDADGNLIVGPDVLRFFDYYFSATGEEKPGAIYARIVAAIHRKLPAERASRQAIALLDKYVGYREAARRMGPVSDDEARLAAIHRLRRDHFGDQADKLFGDEERAAAVAIDQRKVMTDHSLSEGEREKKLAALEASLPPSVREARADSMRPLRERAAEEAMRAAGATDDQIREHRIATDGVEAADRLAELDRTRADWKRRLDDFRKARTGLEQSEPDPAQRSLAVQKLLDTSFTPQEQIRVHAADAMDAEKAAAAKK